MSSGIALRQLRAAGSVLTPLTFPDAAEGQGTMVLLDEREVAEGIKAFCLSMGGVALALVRADDPQKFEGEHPAIRGSGVLIRVGARPVVVSCAHVLRHGTWAVEINTELAPLRRETDVPNIALDDRVVPLRALAPARIPGSSFDFAWTEFSENPGGLAAAVQLGTLPIYQGPVDPPDGGEAYGFIAWNRDEYNPDVRVVRREPSFEVGMQYVGDDKAGMHRFKLAGSHKGHAFYWGASGAPIADPQGRIVALLAHGREAAQGIVTGVPLAKALKLIDADEH